MRIITRSKSERKMDVNCKICNAELKDGALFCPECGTKVGDDVTETPLKCQKCGAELEPGIKFCSQCGTAVTDNQANNTSDAPAETSDENNIYTEQNNDFAEKVKSQIHKKPKYFAAIGIVALILIVSSSISLGVKSSRSKPAETAKTESSSSTSKAGSSSSKSGGSSSSKSGGSYSSKSGSSSSSGALTEDLKKIMVESAIMSEVKQKFPIADAGSTRYKINTSEQKNGYTIVYGKLYLYDKYGKSTTGRSDGSGSYIRTFEVKISNSTNKVSSCTIK